MPNNDYILRSDALNALSRGSGCENICTNAIKRIPAADVEPKQRWNPVTERLPEPVFVQTRRKTKPVLLYSPKGGFYVGWYYGQDYRGHHIFTNRTSKDSLQCITTKVTHWMPLTEPPKEDKGDADA